MQYKWFILKSKVVINRGVNSFLTDSVEQVFCAVLLENAYDFLLWECLKAVWNFNSSLEGTIDVTLLMQL